MGFNLPEGSPRWIKIPTDPFSAANRLRCAAVDPLSGSILSRATASRDRHAFTRPPLMRFGLATGSHSTGGLDQLHGAGPTLMRLLSAYCHAAALSDRTTGLDLLNTSLSRTGLYSVPVSMPCDHEPPRRRFFNNFKPEKNLAVFPGQRCPQFIHSHKSR